MKRLGQRPDTTGINAACGQDRSRIPQPRIRLTYEIGGVSAIVEDERNPRPGEPMLIVPPGRSDGGRIETEGSIERLHVYNQNGDGVLDVA